MWFELIELFKFGWAEWLEGGEEDPKGCWWAGGSCGWIFESGFEVRRFCGDWKRGKWKLGCWEGWNWDLGFRV